MDDEWTFQTSGAGRISIEGFKTRTNTVEQRTFTPKAACKSFFESHLKLSKAHSISLGLDKHFLFKKANGRAPNSGNLYTYAHNYLPKHSKRFQDLINKNPEFRLNCNLLKSSIKQYAEQKLGRLQAATNTRNSVETYDSAKYGKVTKEEANWQ